MVTLTMKRALNLTLILAAFAAITLSALVPSDVSSVKSFGLSSIAELNSSVHAYTPTYPPMQNPTQTQINWIRYNQAFTNQVPNNANAYYSTMHNPNINDDVTTWVQIYLTKPDMNTGTKPTRKMTRYVRSFGKGNEDGGHIVAKILGGPGNVKWNMFPIDPAPNKGDMSSVESQIRKLVQKPSTQGVRMYVRFEYDNTSPWPYRPDKIWIMAEEHDIYGTTTTYVWDGIKNPWLCFAEYSLLLSETFWYRIMHFGNGRNATR